MADPITRPRKPKKPKPVRQPRENHFVGVPVSRKVVAALATATGAPQIAVVQAIARRITPELLREVHKELTEQTRLLADQQLEETLRAAFTATVAERQQELINHENQRVASEESHGPASIDSILDAAPGTDVRLE